ncbi:IS66 family transposase [Franzmannia pantelleriensis]|uniref:IS66 family transposase n=1 Tax=Franzmannia pantelleriensis TaxID=48727 RepID=UPI001FDF2828|nr:IS66 family transposase [Halomonas pantelleriensis]
MPLYRQSQIFARHGAEIPCNTLALWMVQVGERLMPLIEALRQHLLRAPLIHMDETTLQVNAEADRPASSRSYMWLQRGGTERWRCQVAPRSELPYLRILIT